MLPCHWDYQAHLKKYYYIQRPRRVALQLTDSADDGATPSLPEQTFPEISCWISKDPHKPLTGLITVTSFSFEENEEHLKRESALFCSHGQLLGLLYVALSERP